MTDEPGRFWRTHQEVLSTQHRDGTVYPKECPGALRVEGERPLVVRCDSCGELMGVRGDPPEPPAARDSDKRTGGRRRRRDATEDDPFLGAT